MLHECNKLDFSLLSLLLYLPLLRYIGHFSNGIKHLLFYCCKCTKSWAWKREMVPLYVTRHLHPTSHGSGGMLQKLGKAHQSCSFPRWVLAEQKLCTHCQKWRNKKQNKTKKIFSLLKTVSVPRFCPFSLPKLFPWCLKFPLESSSFWAHSLLLLNWRMLLLRMKTV